MTYPSLSSLDPNARELATQAVAFMDSFWDAGAGLLWYPGYEASGKPGRRVHLVRETVWYALGLFLRRQGADSFRALHALEAILDYQFNTPGRPYHGTFARTPEEALPPAEGAQEWKDYDPNWREFIVTIFQILLAEYEPLLPHPLVARIDAAARLAVEGALERGLRPGYTNIALMNAFMVSQAGARLNQPAWVERGEEMARAIYALYDATGAFEEYNSPTYYGPDLYALGLWRKYAVSPLLRRLGAEMEARLWLDLSRFYHPGLRNQCGPYDRSYGMDMTRYAAILGQWIWLAAGPAAAPFPEIELPFAHTADFCYAPCVAILGLEIPAEARARLLAFDGPRQVEQVITREPRRVASAWLEERFMWGGEHTSGTKAGYSQFHPATLHWQAAPGGVGWMRLTHLEPVDVAVTGRTMTLTARGPLAFQIYAPGLAESDLVPERWTLPGLTVRVSAPDAAFATAHKPEWLEVSYTIQAPSQVRLEIDG